MEEGKELYVYLTAFFLWADLFLCRRSGCLSTVWNEVARFSKDMKALLVDRVFVVNVLGN